MVKGRLGRRKGRFNQHQMRRTEIKGHPGPNGQRKHRHKRAPGWSTRETKKKGAGKRKNGRRESWQGTPGT